MLLTCFSFFFKQKPNYIKSGNNPLGKGGVYSIPGPPEAESGARGTIMEAKFSSIAGGISEQSAGSGQRKPLCQGENPPSTWDGAQCTKKLVQISGSVLPGVRNMIQGKPAGLTELSFLVCELEVEKHTRQTR